MNVIDSHLSDWTQIENSGGTGTEIIAMIIIWANFVVLVIDNKSNARVPFLSYISVWTNYIVAIRD